MSRDVIEPAAGQEGEDRVGMDKQLATIRAKAAFFEGIAVEPSRDERGRRTIILTRGALTREVPVEELGKALRAIKNGAMPVQG